MYVLRVQNTRGEMLTLTQNEPRYQIVEIDGLNPPKANINSSTVAGMDGTQFISSKLEERNIVITIKINGDVESNRQYLYKFFRTKQYCKLFYKNNSRDVYTEGYVESIECSQFTDNEQMQISVICNDPYFKALVDIVTDISQVVGNFTFPFAFGANGVIDQTTTDNAIEFSTIDEARMVTVVNKGETPNGVIIEVNAVGGISNLRFYNVTTNESFAINVEMQLGDKLIINTNKGNKRIYLTHNGVTTNYINHIVMGSSWFQLEVGDNVMTYEADAGAEFATVIFRQTMKYEGV